MSEQKIPAEITEAATEAIEKVRYDKGIGFFSSEEIAEMVLSAAMGAEQIIASRQMELNQARQRIAELEADTDRLRWLMTDIDGASNVAGDRHSFASNLARERGHDEPTPEDELDGFRRLIDMAMETRGGASE